MNVRLWTLAAIVSAILPCLSGLYNSAYAQSREAERATRAANGAFAASVPLADNRDFEDAMRGLVATIPEGFIAGSGARPVWNMKLFAFEQTKPHPRR